MRMRPSKSPTSARASGRRRFAISAPSSATRGRRRSSGPTDAARRGMPPTRCARGPCSRWRSRSSPSRSTRGRTAPARSSFRVPSRRSSPALSSGCSGRVTRRARLFPIEASLPPDVREGDEEDADEDPHLDEAVPLELSEQDGPRVEEHGFDIEDDEEHRGQVEANREAPHSRRVRDDSRLVRKELLPVRLGRAEKETESDHRPEQAQDDDDEDQNWDVAFQQIRINSIWVLRKAALAMVFAAVLDLDA